MSVDIREEEYPWWVHPAMHTMPSMLTKPKSHRTPSQGTLITELWLQPIPCVTSLRVSKFFKLVKLHKALTVCIQIYIYTDQIGPNYIPEVQHIHNVVNSVNSTEDPPNCSPRPLSSTIPSISPCHSDEQLFGTSFCCCKLLGIESCRTASAG